MEDRRVCVTGGTGFVASWLITKLLHKGYSVNTTIRSHTKNDLTYLTNLPGASQRLRIFRASLEEPDSFVPSLEGCTGVFHVAHPMEWDEEETEEAKTKRVIGGLLGVLHASLESKTVERFIYTSSASAVVFNGKDSEEVDEDSWTDVDFVRGLGMYGGSYVVTKTLAEKTALEFGLEHGLDVVTVLPTWIHGPFLGPHCPNSVRTSLALVLGDEENYKFLVSTSFVHAYDVARAHIHLLECPKAKGRYICSAVEVTIDKLFEFLRARYPEFKMPPLESLKGITAVRFSGLSSEKLTGTGFEYEYGLEEMFDGAIQSSRERGLLL